MIIQEAKDKVAITERLEKEVARTFVNEREAHQQKLVTFQEKVDASRDLSDQLQNLVDHLHEWTESTAVYIGKVTHPINKINDDDDDTAHIIEGATPHIQYVYADPAH